MAAQLYDKLGRGYASRREPDPRIAAAVLRALSGATSVVNVGAGGGSYEPMDREVVAVEPSRTMLAQRPPGSARAVQAGATQLPFIDGCFDAAMAVLTMHHWPDWRLGLRELRRVSRRRVVLLTWDPESEPFWLGEYFPEIWEIDRQIFPRVDELIDELGEANSEPLPIPHDCRDGFLGAYWRRPEAYLEPDIRASISTFARVEDLQAGLIRLREDLNSNRWTRAHGAVAGVDELDLGYRLIVGSEEA